MEGETDGGSVSYWFREALAFAVECRRLVRDIDTGALVMTREPYPEVVR